MKKRQKRGMESPQREREQEPSGDSRETMNMAMKQEKQEENNKNQKGGDSGDNMNMAAQKDKQEKGNKNQEGENSRRVRDAFRRFLNKIKSRTRRRDTQLRRNHYGLHNKGGTCCLNSVLQVLFMTTEIHDRLVPWTQKLDYDLISIFENLKKNTSDTENIIECLEINYVNEQRDAAECLEMILHKVGSEVSEVFKGELINTTKCSEGHTIIEEKYPFWTLPLSLEDTDDAAFSVEKNFERFFLTKTFSGDNLVYCSECQIKREATTDCEMVGFPQILTLLLKKFDFDYNAMSHVKSEWCVEVPLLLKTKGKKYQLYGIVNHKGCRGEGHYTATILSNEDNNWYEYDDIRISKVEGEPFAKETYKSSTAYLLMYRSKNTEVNNVCSCSCSATECQTPTKSNSEDHEEQAEDIPPKEVKEDESKGNVSNTNTEDEEKPRRILEVDTSFSLARGEEVTSCEKPDALTVTDL